MCLATAGSGESGGFRYWMRQFGGTGFAGVIYHDLTTEQAWVMGMLKYGVLAGAAFVGWIRRREDESGLFRTLALTWLVFLIFSPSVAAQYLVWPAAFLLVWSPRWYAGITLAASVFLGAFYTILCRGWPWDFGVSDKDTCPLWLPWSNIAWVGVDRCRCRGGVIPKSISRERVRAEHRRGEADRQPCVHERETGLALVE